MATDLSIYNNVFKPDPMGGITMQEKFLGLQHAQTQNQLLSRELKGQQALGRIVAQSTDENGTINPVTFRNKLSKDPDASYLYFQQEQERQKTNPLLQNIGKNGQPVNTPYDTLMFPQPSSNRLAPAPRKQPQQSADDGEQPPVESAQGMNNDNGLPSLSQQEVDGYHQHVGKVVDTLKSLINDPTLDRKKCIGAACDLVADPSVKFTKEDGISQISQLPSGPNGASPSPEQLKSHLVPMLEEAETAQRVLNEQYPSSTHRAAKSIGQFAQQEQETQPVDLYSPSGAPIDETPKDGTQGFAVGVSPSFERSNKNYEDVVAQSASVPQTLAAYNEIINLNEAGAETGTRISSMYQWLAKNVPGISADITDKASQTQQIAKWMSKALAAQGMPTSDARLGELQAGNLNEEQLSATIRKLAPFFVASAEGAKKKLQFYNKITQNGRNFDNEPAAQQLWTENYDPRWLEYAALPNETAKDKFFEEHPDMANPENLKKLKNLKSMGVIGKKE